MERYLIDLIGTNRGDGSIDVFSRGIPNIEDGSLAVGMPGSLVTVLRP